MKETLGGYYLFDGRRPRRRHRAGRPDPGRPLRWLGRGAPAGGDVAVARAGLPRRVGAGARVTGGLPRRLRPRRGSHPGRLCRRRRAMAARGRPAKPRRVAGDHRPQPSDRPAPPRTHPERKDAAAGGVRGAAATTGGDHDVSRRTTRAGLHLLPPGAGGRCPGGADAAHPGRADHRGDRPRVPGSSGDDDQTPHPSETKDQRRRDPVSGATRTPAARAPGGGARGRLSDLQRGLRRPHRAGHEAHPAGPRRWPS